MPVRGPPTLNTASSRTFEGAQVSPRPRSSERPLPARRACCDLDIGSDDENGEGDVGRGTLRGAGLRSVSAGEPGIGGTAGSNLNGPCDARPTRFPALRPQLPSRLCPEDSPEASPDAVDIGDAGTASRR